MVRHLSDTGECDATARTKVMDYAEFYYDFLAFLILPFSFFRKLNPSVDILCMFDVTI
jgi:hypothetical protein